MTLSSKEMKGILKEFRDESELNRVLHDVILIDSDTNDYDEAWDCATEDILYYPLDIADGCGCRFLENVLFPAIKPYEETINQYIDKCDDDLDLTAKAFIYFSKQLKELVGDNTYSA